MAQRNKRLKGVYRCDRQFASSKVIEGTIYNAFPVLDADELKEGQRAFFFPTVSAMYIPPEETGREFLPLFGHEYTHRVVSGVVATCEMQFLIYLFLGVMMDFLTDPECKILIPSFTVKFPNGETNDFLSKLAIEFDDLYFATGLIHEIVANAVQAEWVGLERETAKKNIKASLEEFGVDADRMKFVKKLLAKPLLDEFLNVYNQVGSRGACLLARYALNSFQASREIVVERFERAVQLAGKFHGSIS